MAELAELLKHRPQSTEKCQEMGRNFKRHAQLAMEKASSLIEDPFAAMTSPM